MENHRQSFTEPLAEPGVFIYKKRPGRLPPSDTVRRLYFELLTLLNGTCLPLKTSMTSRNIMAAVSDRWPDTADDIAVFTDCYEKLRYEKKTMDAEELKYAKTLFDNIKSFIISPDTKGDVKYARDDRKQGL
ncbi:DUF4129 domain-containing protein [Calorimonas adulescens]|uniref:DUF4129 domain-containing protein n=1 Tax=Calorimonas adulescens TaxID=2606906 RepID=UPI0013967F90|nr:DUF4129 domain-containing protein [Calorimonas adulescens]